MALAEMFKSKKKKMMGGLADKAEYPGDEPDEPAQFKKKKKGFKGLAEKGK